MKATTEQAPNHFVQPIDVLSKLVHSSLDVICSIDKYGKFKFVSNAARMVFGYEPAEMVGRPFLDFVVEDDHLVTKIIAELVTSGSEFTNFENRHKRKDGTIVPIVWSARWDNEDQIAYCVARDGTEKKKAEEDRSRDAQKIAAQNKEMVEALERMHDGFFTLDSNWRVTYFNCQAELLSGKRREELLGKILWKVWPMDVGGFSYKECHRAMSEKVQVNFEMYSKVLKGWFNVTVYPTESGIAVYLKNITERKRQEEELRNINQRYELISKATSDVVWDWDIFNDTIHYGHSLKALFGYEAFACIDKGSHIEKIHDDDRSRVIISLKSTLLNPSFDRWETEYRFRRNDGTFAFVFERGFIIRNQSGVAVRMTGSMQDITTQKIKGEELYKLSLVATETSNSVIITDAAGRITWVNKAFTDITEYTAEEAMGRKPSELLQGPNTSAKAIAYLRRQIAQRAPFSCEIINYSKSGKEYWIELRGQPLFNERGEVDQFFAIQTDITERMALQQMVVEEQIAAQQEVTRAIIDTQEQERSIIARELHDNVNQILATIKLYLENLDHVPERRDQFLRKAISLSELALTESRRLSHQLVTPELRDFCFRQAVESLLEHYATINLFTVNYNFTLNDDDLSKELQIAIFRILQEAMNNVVKYAKATEVFVGLLLEEKEIRVVVKDNGIGIDSTKKALGLGLKNIQNRVSLYKGKLIVDSSPGNGCTLTMKFRTEHNSLIKKRSKSMKKEKAPY